MESISHIYEILLVDKSHPSLFLNVQVSVKSLPQAWSPLITCPAFLASERRLPGSLLSPFISLCISKVLSNFSPVLCSPRSPPAAPLRKHFTEGLLQSDQKRSMLYRHPPQKNIIYIILLQNKCISIKSRFYTHTHQDHIYIDIYISSANS